MIFIPKQHTNCKNIQLQFVDNIYFHNFFEPFAVMNLVYELPLTHHQRSLAHHMDSFTTLTVARHLRLQFTSSIALTKHTADCNDHTADCTDHTPYINHVLYSVYPSDSYSTEPTQLFLPCLALPCLALPCLALPCLALPCLFFSGLIPARVPGSSLCFVLLDIVCRS